MEMAPEYNLGHGFLVGGPGAKLWGEQLEGLWRGKDMENYRSEIRDHLKPATLDSRPSVPVGGSKAKKTKVYVFHIILSSTKESEAIQSGPSALPK